MAILKTTVISYRCERCQHTWLPRRQGAALPKVCPMCKSTIWNRPEPGKTGPRRPQRPPARTRR